MMILIARWTGIFVAARLMCVYARP